MPSFTGVSIVVDGKLSTTSAVDDAGTTHSGYHLFLVQGYARTNQTIPTGKSIRSGAFMLGGVRWFIEYYPNGETPECADFISIYLCLHKEVNLPVDARFDFCFIDQVEKQKPMYIRAIKTSSFDKNGYNCWGYDKFVRKDALERSTDMKTDSFTIRCDIIVGKEPSTHDDGPTTSDIGQHLSNLLENKVGADVTFNVSGETITAHRCVLAARSTVFMAQLFGPMKEGTTSSVIHINDIEAEVFRALLAFIYTGSFPNMAEEKSQDVEDAKEEKYVKYVRWLQDLLVAADIYDLQRLKHLCEEHLSNCLGAGSVASTLALAMQHYCHGLKEACFKFIQVQSPPFLEKLMGTDGWEHIRMTYPSLINDINSKLASKN